MIITISIYRYKEMTEEGNKNGKFKSSKTSTSY